MISDYWFNYNYISVTIRIVENNYITYRWNKCNQKLRLEIHTDSESNSNLIFANNKSDILSL